LLALLICAFLFPGCAKKDSPYDLKYPDLKFVPPVLTSARFTLDNGVTAFIVEDKKLPVLDIHARFRTGGLMESPAEKGLASMTADLIEEGGTRSIPADSLDALLEFHAMGLSSDADFTGAMVSLSCLSEKTELGLDLFNRVLREPAFEEKKLALAKERIIEDIRHRFDAPANTLRMAGRYALYGRDAWSELLSERDVKIMNRDALVKFYQTYFRPENMIIGVSGRFDAREMLRKLNNTIGTWKTAGGKEAVFPKLVMAPGKRFLFVEKDINQAYVRIGSPLMLLRPHPDYYPVILMNWVLGGASFTSRISKKVREQEGLAYDAGSSVSCEYFYPGSFNVVLQTKSASTAYAIDLVFKEIREFLKSGALDTELAAGKQGLADAFPSAFQNGNKVARAFTYNQYVKETDDNIEQYCARVRAVTLADIQRVAESYLKPESLSICIVGKYAECEKGDGTHKAKLADFGTAVKMTEKEINKALDGE
jgi:predicted Zn-dependent peptidase